MNKLILKISFVFFSGFFLTSCIDDYYGYGVDKSYYDDYVKFTPKETSIINEIDGLKKEDIWLKTRLWFADVFNSSESAIDFEDKSTGIIIGKGKHTLNYDRLGNKNEFNFTIKLEAKDNKYKITSRITELFYSNLSANYSHPSNIANSEKIVNEYVTNLQQYIENQQTDTW